jgi:hypothetical protein
MTNIRRYYFHFAANATLRKERRLTVFENSVMRRIFVPTTDEVPTTGIARSEAWVWGRWLVGMVGSQPAGGMDVCLLGVLFVVR